MKKRGALVPENLAEPQHDLEDVSHLQTRHGARDRVDGRIEPNDIRFQDAEGQCDDRAAGTNRVRIGFDVDLAVSPPDSPHDPVSSDFDVVEEL